MRNTGAGLGTAVIGALKRSRQFGLFGKYVALPIDTLPDELGRKPTEINGYLAELESKGIVEINDGFVKLSNASEQPSIR